MRKILSATTDKKLKRLDKLQPISKIVKSSTVNGPSRQFLLKLDHSRVYKISTVNTILFNGLIKKV